MVLDPPKTGIKLNFELFLKENHNKTKVRSVQLGKVLD